MGQTNRFTPYAKETLSGGEDVPALMRYIEREFEKIEEAFGQVLANPHPVQHTAPPKTPRAVDDALVIAYADGTDWNPGQGAGYYAYVQGTGWKKIAWYSDISTPPVAATQAEEEAASSTTVFTSPGRQKYHPGVAKAAVSMCASSQAGTYSRTGTTVTVTPTVWDDYQVGDTVYLQFTTGTAVDGTYTIVTSNGSTSYTVTTAASGTTSGNVSCRLHTYFVYGISSVVWTGTGLVTINFSTAFSRAKGYAMVCGIDADTTSGINVGPTPNVVGAPTASAINLRFNNGAGTAVDSDLVYLAFLGDQ